MNHSIAAAALSLAAMMSGCSSMDAESSTGHYEVRVETPMYRYGPAQSFGPDFTLKVGQHVVLMRKDFGYSRVMTDEGQSGYVATEDIVPSKTPTVASNSRNENKYPGIPLPLQGRTVAPSDGRGSRFSGPVLQQGALFGADELPPLPDNQGGAEGKPKPEFRYPKPKPGFRVTVPSPDQTPAP